VQGLRERTHLVDGADQRLVHDPANIRMRGDYLPCMHDTSDDNKCFEGFMLSREAIGPLQ
jgi:hypothetical protein